MEPKLSKETIVQAAFELLKETPELEKLSMRKVAKKLGVQAPAIYWHIENKQALLQRMAEEIENHFISPTPKDNWKETIYAYMENYYELYQQYPCAIEIEIQTIPSYSSRLKNLDAILGILNEAGFSIELSYMTITSLQHLLFGMLMDSNEEKKLYNKVMAGDDYLKTQIILMKQSVQEHELDNISKSIQYRQKEKQKDFFMKTLRVFLNGLDSLI
ncbi:TetR family transcriptional regulator [Enterococcus ureilyticus]|uniref:TetR family transcriptional regulator n=1 Tax=Enterococcus ureilyticus TaxID=1131292 RepID=A0A1E5HFD2_9ENTE|nr:TetR family transcriptional regulator [Enterococcus ureilyticus]MBM7689488.1 AcrR family transcriptional regulator [Enterococcus ureilyticus]MBO0444929.1 TetR/AcrR family transcriptional regulator C-terminal domain-containing protein [Enterococcus ureilyticus]OEG23662.1 TetR family transcriptional regulator [Enterococcus ureilyticus]